MIGTISTVVITCDQCQEHNDYIAESIEVAKSKAMAKGWHIYGMSEDIHFCCDECAWEYNEYDNKDKRSKINE